MQKMDKDVVVHSKEPEDEEEDEVTPMVCRTSQPQGRWTF